ncbi:hypothetical protein GCM10009504_28230 [Pseudomonas laurentiana]|uniref:transposase n=1 Tax=Pseudomonas laurentiana TaxID=2364649 RepID=UPI0019932EF6|nr:hypothetical protein GCM10009504_28230 [Pseudomonas laurentiana]
MEEALYEITSMRQFARLTLSTPIPEDTTIMNFRHLLEKHQLAAGILETINTYLGNQYYFGMRAHIGADAESGLVHHVHSTAANVADVTKVAHLLHGAENVTCADAGYTGVEKRPEHEGRPAIWQIATHVALISTWANAARYKAKRMIEKAKAQVRAKVEYPFRVIKRQLGYVKTRFRGLTKNTAN